MANPVWQSASISATGTVGAPSGTAVGDLLITHITGDSNGATITAPSGWTHITGNTGAGAPQNYTGGIYWRIATVADVGGSYVWSTTGDMALAVHRITGADLTTPINTSATVQGGSALQTGTLSGGVTPSVTSTLLMMFSTFANSSDTNTAVAVANSNPTWTAAAGEGNNSANIRDWYGNYAPSTTTGNATATFSPSNTGWALALVAIAPAQPVTVNVAVFGSAFSMVAPGIVKSMIQAVFGSLFSILTPATSDTASSKWTNQAKHSASWTDTPKS